MKKMAPSQLKEQAIRELLGGRSSPEADGASLLSELIRLSTERTIQELLEQEQEQFLGRERYGRAEGRVYRNGYEDVVMRSAEGVLRVRKPQVRGLEGPYRSPLWERLETKSEVLEKIVTEMYVRGLSVRDIEQAMIDATGTFVLSNSAVSEVTAHLHEQYEAFRTRDLSGYDIAFLFVDAIFEPLRRFGSSLAVLCAWAICVDGSRVLLHLQSGQSESLEAYLDFFRDMTSRGMRTPLTITTDGASGLIAAVEKVFPRSLRIRCWFHKMQNLQAKVPKDAWQEFRDLVTEVRDASTIEHAKARVEAICEQYEGDLPEACRCLKNDLEASLNHIDVIPKHRIYVRTTNLIERAFEEERRRTKIIPSLVDEKTATKLVFAILIRVSNRWQRTKFSPLEQRQILRMREQRLKEKQPETTPAKRRSPGHVAA